MKEKIPKFHGKGAHGSTSPSTSYKTFYFSLLISIFFRFVPKNFSIVGGPTECRYGLFDFEYMHRCQGTSDSSRKEKLFLLSWCPETAKIKQKMLYASSYDSLKKALVGVQKYIQATDLSEASREYVEEKLRQNDRI